MTVTVVSGHDGLTALPSAGRLLGVDPGRKRVGLAVTDDAQRVASARETVETGRDHAATASAIADEVRALDVVGAVVGWPRALDGTVGEAAEDAADLAAALADVFGVPALLWDERFSTVEAERVMIQADTRRAARRQQIDRVAATLLLQTVLDARRTTDSRGR